MTARKLEKKITSQGWVLVRVTGSHHQYKNPNFPGTATIPFHKGDISRNVVNSLEKQTGLSLRR